MKIEVSIPRHDYPAEVRGQVEEKLQRLARYFDRTESIRALLEQQQHVHRVELVASARPGVVLVVDSRADSLSKALDESVDRMSNVLSRHKQKLAKAARRREKGG